MSAPTDGGSVTGLRALAIVRWALVALSATLAGWTWWTLALAPPEVSGAEARYYCPMHPQVTAPVAGVCPICSMQLVPIEDRDEDRAHPHEADELGAPVMLGPAKRRLIGVATVAVETIAGGAELVLPAEVQAHQAGITEVRARVSGYVERAAVRETGAQVRAGQALAWLYAPELVQAQEELLVAARWGDGQGQALAARARERLALLGVASADIEAIASAGRVQRAVPIRAPRAGWVLETRAVPGARVGMEDALYVIADLSRVWVVASGFAAQRAAIERAAGGSASFVPADGAPVEVELDRIVPSVEREARTVEVRFGASNPALGLLPGQIGEVVIAGAQAEALAVPRDAVIDTGDQRYVLVEIEPGTFEPRTVELGALIGEQRVVRGVREGERVVARGTFVLDAESRVTAAFGRTGTGSGSGSGTGSGSGSGPGLSPGGRR